MLCGKEIKGMLVKEGLKVYLLNEYKLSSISQNLKLEKFKKYSNPRPLDFFLKKNPMAMRLRFSINFSTLFSYMK